MSVQLEMVGVGRYVQTQMVATCVHVGKDTRSVRMTSTAVMVSGMDVASESHGHETEFPPKKNLHCVGVCMPYVI